MSLSATQDAQYGSWTITSTLGKGGQGATYVANNRTGGSGCLKILSDRNVKERRQRFAREAACYASVDIAGIPKFIESNTDNLELPDDCEYYILTELINGKSIDLISTANKTCSEVIQSTVRLMQIVHDLHRSGIVHRDIKPQNIIARGSDLNDLFLVDFGLAFNSVALDDFRTETGQELGNRFLRLPEMQAGSRIKQDPISDVTFGVGILFFLATGIAPRSLFDGKADMPHQRANVVGNRINNDSDFRMLLPIFDKGFKLRLEERYQSATELIIALDIKPSATMPHQQSLEQIIADLENPDDKNRQQRINNRNRFIDTVHLMCIKMARSLNGVYLNYQTSHQVNREAASTVVGFCLGEDQSILEVVPFESKVVGSQIVATAWGEEILRVNADSPDWGVSLGTSIETALLKALNSLRSKTPRVTPD